RAFDQANLDVGLHRQPVVFCLDRAGITGDDGPSHHGVLDLVLMSKVPGMTIFCPSSYEELGVMLHDALDLTDGPSMLRWPKTPAPSVGPDEVGQGLRGRKLRTGADVCLIGVGKMLAAAEEAADLLAEAGIEATVWDPRVAFPMPDEVVEDALAHPAVVTIEDGYRDGGVGSILAERLRDTALAQAPAIRVLGVPTRYIPHGKADAILARLGLDGAGVARSTRELLDSL
ncbi:MAG: transketolase C-terminal domain-containing protein, partial [Actinomycetota bacterium]